MGSELVNYSSPKNSALSSRERFNKILPYYRVIGMTRDEYWNGDPALAIEYREMDDINKHRTNEICWLIGLYVYEALCDVAPALHPFSKHPKPTPYVSEPHELSQKEKEEREEDKNQQKLRELRERFIRNTKKNAK